MSSIKVAWLTLISPIAFFFPGLLKILSMQPEEFVDPWRELGVTDPWETYRVAGPWDILWNGSLQKLKREYYMSSASKPYFTRILQINGKKIRVEVIRRVGATPLAPSALIRIRPESNLGSDTCILLSRTEGMHFIVNGGPLVGSPNHDLYMAILDLGAQGHLNNLLQ